MLRHWILIALPLVACAAPDAARSPRASTPTSEPTGPQSASVAGDPVAVPEVPAVSLRPRVRVASGLLNPRGMRVLGDDTLLLAEAGTGDPEQPMSGALTRLRDHNGDGDFLDDGERETVLGNQPSKNIVDIVRRDEVFGMAGMDAGEGGVLVAQAFFGGPTTLFFVKDGQVERWGSTHLNINDVAYDPGRRAFFGVGSSSDEVVRLLPGGGVERVIKLPPLASGQDAVPGYVRYDPVTRRLLVSLFSGSPVGEEGGEGVELVHGAGGIIVVDPDARSFEWLVTGLSVPTDLEVAADGSIYVLEFCDQFLDPVATRADMLAAPSHGGFRRFSGRLLRVDRSQRSVTVLAEQLDAPSNLTLSGEALYIAEGMGTPGRPIPGPGGAAALEGFIERVLVE